MGPVGRVHWLSLVPDVQGRGLAKPLLGAVLRTLVQLHSDDADGAVASGGDGAVDGQAEAEEESEGARAAAEGSAPPPVLVWLKTHCQAARAIGMYLEVGFEPTPLAGSGCDPDISLYEEAEGEGWQRLAALGLPIKIPGTELE